MDALSLCRPFGFLEAFDPGYTPNTTDEMGRRYTFQQQPTIGQSNLAQLAQAFLIGELIDQVLNLPLHNLIIPEILCPNPTE